MEKLFRAFRWRSLAPMQSRGLIAALKGESVQPHAPTAIEVLSEVAAHLREAGVFESVEQCEVDGYTTCQGRIWRVLQDNAKDPR